VVIAATTDTIYVLAASVAGSAIGKSPRIQTLGRYASAATFIGLGIFTAASGTRAVK
jgi:threonine/homoserine/homoserine lactone efflux protein